MKLLADLGNSRAKWACYENLQFTLPGGCDSTGIDFKDNLKNAWQVLPNPSQVVYCAVTGPALAAQLESVALELWQLHARRLMTQSQAFGLRCHYLQPKQLGADRWAAMIGAYARVGRALCVVDCGTAVTVDAVAADGQHQGGLIIPGQTLMRRALGDHTSGIGHVHAGHINLASVDTRGAVSTGCALAVAAFIDHAVRAYQNQLQRPLQVLLTGGDAECLLPHLQTKAEVIPELVMLGLAEFAESDP